MSPTVVNYDVSGVDPQSSNAFAGVFDAKIIKETSSIGKSKNGDPMLTVGFEIVGGEHNGRKIRYWIMLDPQSGQEWRMREFTDAIGLPPKGKLDIAKLDGTMVKIRTVVRNSDEYGEQTNVKNVLPAEEGGAAGGEEEPPYDEWELDELKTEIEAREIKITGRISKKKLVDALYADDEADGGDEEEEEEEVEEEEAEEEGYSMSDLEALDRAGLKAVIKDESLEVKVLKKDSDDDLRAKVAEALGVEADEEETEEEEEGEEEEGEEEEGEEVDYNEWSISDLKADLQERGLDQSGRKSSLVKRLQEDDAKSSGDPF